MLPADQSEYWRAPLRIRTFSEASVRQFVQEDLFQILRPTEICQGDRDEGFRPDRNAGPVSYFPLTKIVEGRGLRIVQGEPTTLRSLTGDTHNGSRRPIELSVCGKRMVLKFADPRPHILLRRILVEFSRTKGVDLVPPATLQDETNRWYLMDYCCPDNAPHPSPDEFMFNLGALTSVAFCLRIVDLHPENIVVSGGRPIIVDPECLAYVFGSDDCRQRLYDTRLLHDAPSASGLRGGIRAYPAATCFGIQECADGRLAYRRPAHPTHNHILDQEGFPIDPSTYSDTFIAGYEDGFSWFVNHAGIVAEIIDAEMADDFRIRYLVRDTAQYLTVLHMLNLPTSCSYPEWRDCVYRRFQWSPHFPSTLDPRTLDAEIFDLDNRDVPYFWVNAGERVVRHRSGITQVLPLKRCPRDQVRDDIRALDLTMLWQHRAAISEFLHTPA